jgi:hypothetical protein
MEWAGVTRTTPFIFFEDGLNILNNGAASSLTSVVVFCPFYKKFD